MHETSWIRTDPAILGGKPCVRGTRISVEFILELLAGGASHRAILDAYPQVTAEGPRAAIEYAAMALRDEVIWEIPVSA